MDPLTCDVCIVGGGMVGAATAFHLAQAAVGSVHVIDSATLPSSSVDCSRMLAASTPAAQESVAGYRMLEERSGVTFWEESPGFLKVVPSTNGGGPVTVPSTKPLVLASLFGDGGFRSTFIQKERGWIDPTGFVRACREAAERSGRVKWSEGRAVKVAGRGGSQGPPFEVTLSCGSVVLARHAVVLAVGAFAALSPGLFAGAVEKKHTTTMWGKAVFHAEVDDETAQALLQAGMPCFVVTPTPGYLRESEVGYVGKKRGDYVYGFPPIRYPDGRWRVKIGHSPVDPVVADLGRSKSIEGVAVDNAVPSDEQVRIWFQGREADPSTTVGADVRRRVAESEEFFADVLHRLLPDVKFLSGYCTTCVTAKSDTGDRVLRAVVPGVFHQTGCNGEGAASAFGWGREVADVVMRSMNRPAL